MLGALRLLAASYGAQELNNKGYMLYVEFRPTVDGWGAKGEVKCEAILGLRKKKLEMTTTTDDDDVKDIVKYDDGDDVITPKKPREG
jgi:hypothetical protein